MYEWYLCIKRILEGNDVHPVLVFDVVQEKAVRKTVGLTGCASGNGTIERTHVKWKDGITTKQSAMDCLSYQAAIMT